MRLNPNARYIRYRPNFKMHFKASSYFVEAVLARDTNAFHLFYPYSSLQTLVSDFVPSQLYVLRYSLLLRCFISSLTSFVFGGGYPYWFVGFGVFLEFIDEVVEVLLFLLSVLQGSLLEFWIVFLLHVSIYPVGLAIFSRRALNSSSSVGDTQ